jgi:GNAT superfamily N-acetyltransferase
VNLELIILPLDFPPGEHQLAEVLTVYQQCEDFLALGPVPRASLEMVLADIAHSRAEGGIFCGVYLAEDKTMIGVLDYVPFGYEGDPQQACLLLLMLGAPWRSSGLGAEAANWVEAQVRQAGRARCILSGVQVNNPQAQRFWLRQGYQIISAAQDMGDGTVAYPLRKDL